MYPARMVAALMAQILSYYPSWPVVSIEFDVHRRRPERNVCQTQRHSRHIYTMCGNASGVIRCAAYSVVPTALSPSSLPEVSEHLLVFLTG